MASGQSCFSRLANQPVFRSTPVRVRSHTRLSWCYILDISPHDGFFDPETDHGPAGGGYPIAVYGRNLPPTLKLSWNYGETIVATRKGTDRIEPVCADFTYERRPARPLRRGRRSGASLGEC